MTNEHLAEASKTIDHLRDVTKKVEQDHIADGGKKDDHIREATKKVEGCEYCTVRYREPELKAINLYKGPNYYVMDIERPEGFIPKPWRNKRLYVNFCPICGRRLKES